MKKFKSFLALVIVLAFCLCFTGSAFASNSKFNSTRTSTSTAAFASSQSFLDAMDSEGIKYTYQGLDSDGDDWIEIKYTGDYCDTIDIDVYFSSDEDEANFRFWNVIDFNSEDYREVLSVVNQLNYDYKWAKFYVDTNDYSVTVSLDVLFPTGYAGSICLESLEQIVAISDYGFHSLEPYRIS